MDFHNRLDSLKKRRQGPVTSVIAEDSSTLLRKSANSEYIGNVSFASTEEPEGIKYAVGAMAPVDSRYTQISINEGSRVANSLAKSLSLEGVNVDSRLQGSVGLDVHIKGYSDVDMLVLVGDTLLVETPIETPGSYIDAFDKRPKEEIIGDLRSRSERILPSNFPKVEVVTTGGKSISMEGGSLARKIDIVPAFWYHSLNYQKNPADHNKGVQIFNKLDKTLIANFPFLNRKLINDADSACSGNLKRVVRLIKNLQADAEGESAKSIKNLNSFDVLSLAYDMRYELVTSPYFQLGLVDILLNRLGFLLRNKSYREAIDTPDLTRKVFDAENKLEALSWLYLECNDLAESLGKEIQPWQQTYNSAVVKGKLVY